MSTTTEPQFTPGDKAVWTGTKGLFEQSVTIKAVRSIYLTILGETPDDARTVYDIHAPEVTQSVILGIPGDQLRKAA